MINDVIFLLHTQQLSTSNQFLGFSDYIVKMFNGRNALLLFFSLAKSQSLLVFCSSHKLDHVSLLKVAESVLLLRGGFYFIYGKCFTPFNLHCCFCLHFYLEGPLIVNQIRSQASTEDLQELGSVLI